MTLALRRRPAWALVLAGAVLASSALAQDAGPCFPPLCPQPSIGVACCQQPADTCGIDLGDGVCATACAAAFCPVQGPGAPCCLGVAGPCGMDQGSGCAPAGGSGGSGGAGGAPGVSCPAFTGPCAPGADCCTGLGFCGTQVGPACQCNDALCPSSGSGQGCCLGPDGPCGSLTPLGCEATQPPCDKFACGPFGCCPAPFGPCGVEGPLGCGPPLPACDASACGPQGCCPGPVGACATDVGFGCGVAPPPDAGPLPPPCAAAGDAQPPGSICDRLPACTQSQCQGNLAACDASEPCRHFVACWMDAGCLTANCPACTPLLAGNFEAQSLAQQLKTCADAADCGLGSTCRTDADCSAGLVCFGLGAATVDGAAPARGLCTAPCTSAADCHAVDIGSVCFGFGKPPEADGGTEGGAGEGGVPEGGVVGGYCLELCTPGPSGLASFSPAKCHGRLDQGCTPARTPAGDLVFYCSPYCGSDAACGAGSYCNPRSGLCETTPVTGLALGAKCPLPPDAGPEAGVDQCRGNCSGLTDETDTAFTTICAERCVTGGLGCGWSGPGSSGGYCAFTYSDTVIGGGPGLGDMGACAALCSCDEECENPDLACIPAADMGLLELQSATGKAGICSGKRGVSPSADACIDAGTTIVDAGDDADLGACTFGAVKACRGPGDCLGAQRCNGDASGYDACTCVDAGISDAGDAGPSDAASDATADGGGGTGGTGATDAPSDAWGGRPPAEADGGCGCRTPGRAPAAGGPALLALVVGWLSARRRRLAGDTAAASPRSAP